MGGVRVCVGYVRLGTVQAGSTHQLSTLALTLSSSPFSEIFCRISGSISTMSVRYNGWSSLAQPLATVSPTTPPPAPSSSLSMKRSVSRFQVQEHYKIEIRSQNHPIPRKKKKEEKKKKRRRKRKVKKAGKIYKIR